MAIYWWLDNRNVVPARQRAASTTFLQAVQTGLHEAYPESDGHTHSIDGSKAQVEGSVPPQSTVDLLVRRGDGWGLRVFATSAGTAEQPLRQIKLAGLEGTALTGKATAFVIALVAICAFAFAVYGVVQTGQFSLGAGYQLFIIAALVGMLGGTLVMIPVHTAMNVRMRGDLNTLATHVEAAFAGSEAKAAGAVLKRRLDPFIANGITTIVLSAVCVALYFWFLRAPEGFGWICGLTLGMVILGIYAVISLGATIGAFAGVVEGPGLFADDPPTDGPSDPAAWL